MVDFSFAYMKEAFVTTLLVMAGNRTEKGFLLKVEDGNDDGDDLDDYELWREMKKQVAILREDMGSAKPSKAPTDEHVGRRPEDLSVTLDQKGNVTIAAPAGESVGIRNSRLQAVFVRDSANRGAK